MLIQFLEEALIIGNDFLKLLGREILKITILTFNYLRMVFAKNNRLFATIRLVETQVEIIIPTKP